jgi:hypothetical protein
MRCVETMYSKHASESRGSPKNTARGGDQARMMVNVSGSRARGSSSVALAAPRHMSSRQLVPAGHWGG